MLSRHLSISFFFFNDTATTEIYTLSLHDALPIYYVYSVAKPDGLTLGMPNQSVYMGQVVGDKEARFDVQKLNWIGSPDRNTTLLYIRADTPYISMDEVIKAKVPPKCGGSGRDSSSLIFALED